MLFGSPCSRRMPLTISRWSSADAQPRSANASIRAKRGSDAPVIAAMSWRDTSSVMIGTETDSLLGVVGAAGGSGKGSMTVSGARGGGGSVFSTIRSAAFVMVPMIQSVVRLALPSTTSTVNGDQRVYVVPVNSDVGRVGSRFSVAMASSSSGSCASMRTNHFSFRPRCAAIPTVNS